MSSAGAATTPKPATGRTWGYPHSPGVARARGHQYYDGLHSRGHSRTGRRAESPCWALTAENATIRSTNSQKTPLRRDKVAMIV